MCGIAGAVDLARGVDRAEVAPMVETMSCRGPDDEGLWLSQDEGRSCAALGHRRLAVVDVPGGRQPMTLERHGETLLTLVFSGEVYNFRELRRELEGRGHVFRTASRHRGGPRRLARVGLRRRRAPQRDVRLRDLGHPARGALPGPRPDGRQAAVLVPDAGRGAVRLRAQGDPGAPAQRGRAGPRRHAGAARARQDARARHLPGHARGAPRLVGARAPRGRRRPPLLAARGPRAHRRPGHHGRARPRAARRHRRPPAHRRRAAVRAAVRRPGLLGDHRARGAEAARPGRRPRPLVLRGLRGLRGRVPRRPDARHPGRARTSASSPSTSPPTTPPSCCPTTTSSTPRPGPRCSPPATSRCRSATWTPRSTCCSGRSAAARPWRCRASRPTRSSAATAGSTTPTRWTPTPSRGWRGARGRWTSR